MRSENTFSIFMLFTTPVCVCVYVVVEEKTSIIGAWYRPTTFIFVVYRVSCSSYSDLYCIFFVAALQWISEQMKIYSCAICQKNEKLYGRCMNYGRLLFDTSFYDFKIFKIYGISQILNFLRFFLTKKPNWNHLVPGCQSARLF